MFGLLFLVFDRNGAMLSGRRRFPLLEVALTVAAPLRPAVQQ
jgi:hypothetical protein